MKCKVINASKYNLENEVNIWMENNNIEIQNVTQTSYESSYITLTIFYLEKKEIRKNKLEKLNKH